MRPDGTEDRDDQELLTCKWHLLLGIKDHELRSLAPAVLIPSLRQCKHHEKVAQRRKTAHPAVQREVTRNLWQLH